MKLLPLLGASALSAAFLAASSLPVNAGTSPPRVVRGPLGANTNANGVRQSRRRFTNPGCSGSGTNSFIGGNTTENIAAGNASAVLGGGFNEACDTGSAVGGGVLNLVGDGSGSGNYSSITGGYSNSINASYATIAGGYYGSITGGGSFIGAGDYAYEQTNPTKAGNQIAGTDSFIGAGNQNVIGAVTNSFDGSGDYNSIQGDYSAIVAGGGNTVTNSGGSSFIGAGSENVVGEFAFIGAGTRNTASGPGSSVVSGGWMSTGNTDAGTDSFLGAGDGNTLNSNESVLGGGSTNTVGGAESFLGGGYDNNVGTSAAFSAIVGGNANVETSTYEAIGGGYDNRAEGADAMIPGGQRNEAYGELSFAAGYQAHALYAGSFVWSDFKAGSSALADTAAGQFVVRASGGTYIYSNEADSAGVKLAAGSGAWSNLSDRNAKTDIVPLDDASILAKVARLPVSAWQYKTERGVKHLGPMAQDFYAAFGAGEDDRHITSIDEDGVALAAIKALNAKLTALAERNAALERQVHALSARVR